MEENKVVWPQTPCTQFFKGNVLYVLVLVLQKCLKNVVHLVAQLSLEVLCSLMVLTQQNGLCVGKGILQICIHYLGAIHCFLLHAHYYTKYKYICTYSVKLVILFKIITKIKFSTEIVRRQG